MLINFCPLIRPVLLSHLYSFSCPLAIHSNVTKMNSTVHSHVPHSIFPKLLSFARKFLSPSDIHVF